MTHIPQIVTSRVIGIPGPPGQGITSGQLSAITSDISTLQGEMNLAEADIIAAENAITILQGDVVNLKARWLGVTIDGGGSTIGTGVRVRTMSPATGAIVGWRCIADQSGSIVVNLWERQHPNVPSVTQQITGGTEKPTLSAAQTSEDLSLNSGAGWAINAGYHLWFNVESATTVTYLSLGLLVAWT